MLDDFLFVVDVIDEKIESANPLLEAFFDPIPFRCLDDSRNHIEGKNFFRRRAIAVDVEGDTALQQQPLGRRLALQEFPFR